MARRGNRPLDVRLSTGDWELLEAAAGRAGLPVREFARERLMTGLRPRPASARVHAPNCKCKVCAP